MLAVTAYYAAALLFVVWRSHITGLQLQLLVVLFAFSVVLSLLEPMSICHFLGPTLSLNECHYHSQEYAQVTVTVKEIGQASKSAAILIDILSLLNAATATRQAVCCNPGLINHAKDVNVGHDWSMVPLRVNVTVIRTYTEMF
ncbi:hypothetical protein BKA62DRAFT_675216 [Auriculariales sp. MPI-PUGE-AT-0066]|nr:hypothetical protein BKA62DRAFT_675216 [Auriculariales sp. MPI-PUGE-AT-0066]